MTAHHFFAEPDAFADGVVTLRGDEARHAARVLRVRVGEPITVADGTGRVVQAIVTRSDDVVEAEIHGETHHDPSRPLLSLYQALTKGEKLDDIVEKASEIGVSRVVPFVAERSVVRWDERKHRRAHERWRAIALAAAKQSHSPRVAHVDPVADDASIALQETGPLVVLHASDTVVPLRRVLPERAPDTLGLVVGPEGGLTETEVGKLCAGGGEAAWLGPRILRTETAGVVAAAVISYVYGNLG